jgi:cysteine dioxygenase
MTGRFPPPLAPLFDRLSQSREPCALDLLERALDDLEISADALGESIAIDTAAYVRTLVFRTPHVEMFVMAWLPGQRSPIHDHRGSACAVKVVSGRALEQRYEPGPEGTVVRAAAPQLVGVGTVIGSYDADIHAFGNASMGPAPIRDILVTMHAYSPPLAPTTKYIDGEAVRR